MPINASIIYAKLEDFNLDFENIQFFQFVDILGYTSDMMKLGVVQNTRPRMHPITEDWAMEYASKNKLKKQDMQDLRVIRRLIIKEYFRFYTWFQMSDKFSEHSKIDVSKWIEYHYKLGSLFYQLYYGEE